MKAGTLFSLGSQGGLLENFQNADGSVSIPEALLPYMGGAATIQAS